MYQALLPVVQQQIRYHDWAIREMWRGLGSLPEAELSIPRGTSYDTILATLTHMYMADRVWLNRLSGEGSIQIAAIPVPASRLLEEVWHETLDELCSWTESLTDDRLSATIHYADSSGARFDTPIWQVLLHVVNYGSGHRGQVTGMLRQGGGLPFSTDLIQFHRNLSAKT